MDIQPKQTSKWILGAATLLLLILIYVGVTMYNQHSNTNAITDAPANDSQATDVTSNTEPGAQENQAAANTSAPTNTNSGTAKPTNSNTTPKASASIYRNGTYTSSGTYTSPGGQEKITVTLTLKDDIVTNASVTTIPSEPDSRGYQQQFINNYKPLVIGKSITSLQLSRVAGSSLTSMGFNEAVSQIKAQAKA